MPSSGKPGGFFLAGTRTRNVCITRQFWREAAVDPLSAGGAKAAETAGAEVAKGIGDVVSRMFGPPGDEIGEYLRRKAHYRLNNAERIAEKANRRLIKQRRKGGKVSQRLSYVMLEDGTYSDDELMAEYLGGVLAAGRTPSGKDDRGVAWTKLITSMSTLQLRAHFVLYREWAHAVHKNANVNLASDIRKALMYVSLDDLFSILSEAVPDLSGDAMLTDVISGLSRFELIGSGWGAGNASTLGLGGGAEDVPFEQIFRVYPTLTGLALYGWACGLPGIDPTDFKELDDLLAVDVPVARPAVFLPRITDTNATTEHALPSDPSV